MYGEIVACSANFQFDSSHRGHMRPRIFLDQVAGRQAEVGGHARLISKLFLRPSSV